MPLVTSKEMFKKAYEGGYAIGAFNVNNMEMVQAIVEAANECKSPVILQVSAGARKYANPVYLRHLVAAAVETSDIPIVMHLDHGADFEICKQSIDDGFTSVMIDASSKPWDENIAITRKVVEYAHDHGVVVEAELGKLAGVEDDVHVEADDALFTSPDEVQDFVSATGIDSLAIAIGTSHGAYKFKPGQDPKLRLDILEEVGKRLPGFPIVLHGASSVPQDKVALVNQFGGHMPDAIGIPESELKKAAAMAVCKINIDSDLRLSFTAALRKLCGTSRPLRPPSISRRRTHNDEGRSKAQDYRSTGQRKQGVIITRSGSCTAAVNHRYCGQAAKAISKLFYSARFFLHPDI